MTLPLPPYDGDPDTLQFILDRIADAILDTGGQGLKLRIGTVTLTWSASVHSGAATINHGVGSTPVVCVGTVDATAGLGSAPSAPAVQFQNLGTTTVQAQGSFVTGVAWTGSLTLMWIAIG